MILFPTAFNFRGRKVEVRYPTGPRLLRFTRGARGKHEAGWYGFWTVVSVRKGRLFSMRVPLGRRTIADRLREIKGPVTKILKRPFYVRPSTEIEAYRWLITHAQKPHEDALYLDTPPIGEW